MDSCLTPRRRATGGAAPDTRAPGTSGPASFWAPKEILRADWSSAENSAEAWPGAAPAETS
eukprot:scaffold2666_cov562-Prasinococcus_capsulatus_cf.AAC.2